MIFHDIIDILFVLNDFPFTHIIFGLLPFLSCEKSPVWYSKQCIYAFIGPVYKRQSIQIPRYVCYKCRIKLLATKMVAK